MSSLKDCMKGLANKLFKYFFYFFVELKFSGVISLKTYFQYENLRREWILNLNMNIWYIYFKPYSQYHKTYLEGMNQTSLASKTRNDSWSKPLRISYFPQQTQIAQFHSSLSRDSSGNRHNQEGRHGLLWSKLLKHTCATEEKENKPSPAIGALVCAPNVC